MIYRNTKCLLWNICLFLLKPQCVTSLRPNFVTQNHYNATEQYRIQVYFYVSAMPFRVQGLQCYCVCPYQQKCKAPGIHFNTKILSHSIRIPIITRTTRTPAFWEYPPPPHDYPYYWYISSDPRSKQDKVKFLNLKILPKILILEFCKKKKLHAAHLLKLLNKMCKYKNGSG